MSRNRSRIWYDITMSLTYPSILGAIIYFFFDATIQVTLIHLLERISTSPGSQLVSATAQFHFFEAFGLSPGVGFIGFILVTLFVSVHHSADYLYSKYSESHYQLTNFVLDTVISLLLAIAYIVISRGASNSLNHIKFAFVIFWSALTVTYLIFLWWDINAYFEFRTINVEYAEFYRGMVLWFEISGISSFIVLAVFALLIDRVGWFSITYVILSITILALFTIWFCVKVRKLENITYDVYDNFLRDYKMLPKAHSSDNLISVENMDATDITDCAAIFSATYQKVYSEPWTVESARTRLSELREANPDYCFVLKTNGLIVGFLLSRTFAWFDGTRVWLEEIVVQEEYRKKGFGKLLLNTLFEKCKFEKISSISLISQKGSTAYGIYERQSFKPSSWIHLEIDLNDLDGRP